MKTVVNTKKSKIRIKRNTLRTDSVHVDIELWGTLPGQVGIKLLVFGAEPSGGVYLNYVNNPIRESEVITDEDFSMLIWSLPIEATDELQLSTALEDAVYEQAVRNKKMFFAATGLTLT